MSFTNNKAKLQATLAQRMPAALQAMGDVAVDLIRDKMETGYPIMQFLDRINDKRHRQESSLLLSVPFAIVYDTRFRYAFLG